jgi:putative ABC transport system permease protein
MIKNYFKIAWRTLFRNRTSSIINIGGLAIGMSVALLIGLWIWDELSFNKTFENYDRIGKVMQHQTSNGKVNTFNAMPFPIGEELKTQYGNNFKYIIMSSWTGDHIISAGEKNLSRRGIYMQSEAPHMLSLSMIEGTKEGLKDPHSVLLAASTAKALFGDTDPVNKTMRIDNKLDVKVTGIYKDLPHNSEFSDLEFIAPWDLYITSEKWILADNDRWDNSSFQVLAQIADHTDFKTVNRNIADSKFKRDRPVDKQYKTKVFVHPMSDWHLRSQWDNGVLSGGAIEYVKLFSIIGAFVLLLACINFMNLSTARSEKRAREVGVRKAVGSLRKNLVTQFYIESLLVVICSFGLCLLLAELFLPAFNQMADKHMIIPWRNYAFWIFCLGFCVFTTILAGSYPALYLSSFQPVKVLKGAFRTGRYSSVPRKALVVLQFTISIALIIGTIVVYNQIRFTRNRPIGYDRSGLMMIRMKSPDFYGKFGLLKTELENSGAVTQFAESSGPVTDITSNGDGYSWDGKDPNLNGEFANIWVTHDYGKTVGWQFSAGRDFSREYKTDSSAVIINEAAARFMGVNDPVGKYVRWSGNNQNQTFTYTVIGVAKDMIMESPYDPVRPTIYFMDYDNVNWIDLKLNPNKSAGESIAKVEAVFKKIIPAAPFDYEFADTEFATKFASETRIGKLSAFFAILAIFISCLGLFGLASFTAEQRTKEIGVRKVLGASVFSLWKLLSKDFVALVLISMAIVTPLSYYFMHRWLQNYQYRTEISAWVFAYAGISAIFITLITVSYQSIKAALLNPTKSLKAE